ncbi:MAG: hypothetical protein U5L95_04690 [Candidatus Saccharibacteria bacterium]|nr:hypothetical protein [Candidatus Saccharibacteria bacterium]
MLGLGTKEEPKAKKDEKKTSKKSGKSSAQSDEAKKVLEQMEAKKADGDCAFC